MTATARAGHGVTEITASALADHPARSAAPSGVSLTRANRPTPAPGTRGWTTTKFDTFRVTVGGSTVDSASNLKADDAAVNVS